MKILLFSYYENIIIFILLEVSAFMRGFTIRGSHKKGFQIFGKGVHKKGVHESPLATGM